MELRRHDRYDFVPLPERPVYDWPGGKRLAVAICNNIEWFSFLGGLGSDHTVPGAAQTTRNYAWRDYGNRVGAFRLIDRLSGLGIRPALLLNTDVYDEAPAVLDAAREAGAEIVAHGSSNSDALPTMSADEERAYVEACRDRIAREEGRAPAGWSSPWLQHSPTTLGNLRRAGFDYVLDFRLDDQPVWLSTADGPILSIPYAAELNDSTTMIGRGAGARDFARMIIDEFEELAATRGEQALVMSVVLHSFIAGQPFRLRAVAHALQHIVAAGNQVWHATPADILAAVHETPGLAADAVSA